MHVEIVLAALVLVIAILVAGDFFRRTSGSPNEYPEGPAYDAGRETFPGPRAGSASPHSPLPAFAPYEPAAAGPVADDHTDRDAATTGPRPDSAGPRPTWLV